MTEPVPSRNWPFGREGANTLFVCFNDDHARLVADALQIPGYYTSWGCALMGMRFDKAVVFWDYAATENQQERNRRELYEHIQTKLSPGGKLHVL